MPTVRASDNAVPFRGRPAGRKEPGARLFRTQPGCRRAELSGFRFSARIGEASGDGEREGVCRGSMEAGNVEAGLRKLLLVGSGRFDEPGHPQAGNRVGMGRGTRESIYRRAPRRLRQSRARRGSGTWFVERRTSSPAGDWPPCRCSDPDKGAEAASARLKRRSAWNTTRHG